MTPHYRQNELMLSDILNFRGDFLTFRAENNSKNRPFNAKNDVQILPKRPENNFEKVYKKTLLTPKMVKSRESI